MRYTMASCLARNDCLRSFDEAFNRDTKTTSGGFDNFLTNSLFQIFREGSCHGNPQSIQCRQRRGIPHVYRPLARAVLDQGFPDAGLRLGRGKMKPVRSWRGLGGMRLAIRAMQSEHGFFSLRER